MAQTETQLHIRPADLDKHIVANIDNGIVIIDTALDIYYYNKWMEIQTHKKESDVLFKKLTNIFPNINAKVLARKIKTALRMKNATYYTASTTKYLIPIKINQIQNSHFCYMQQDVSIVPYNIEKNQVALIITDQTRMANTNALLEENIAKVKELNRELLIEKELTKKQHEQLIASSRNAAMGEMISMIAHQWRQPLSIINASVTTMKVKQELNLLDKESVKNAFDKIEKTVMYLSETINDFRDYFKPNKEQTVINLSSLFSKSIYFLKTEMFDYNIQYTQDIDKSINISTYKNEFLQVIINIIKNSIDAFKDKNIQTKYIHVLSKIDKNTLFLKIEDNAGGIERNILAKVFEPYFSTKSKNGTGLGLYMCQTIIEEHLKGNIQISSQDNKTLVEITLPLQEKQS